MTTISPNGQYEAIFVDDSVHIINLNTGLCIYKCEPENVSKCVSDSRYVIWSTCGRYIYTKIGCNIARYQIF